MSLSFSPRVDRRGTSGVVLGAPLLAARVWLVGRCLFVAVSGVSVLLLARTRGNVYGKVE